MEPPKHLAIDVFGIHMPAEPVIEDDIIWFVADVNHLSRLLFFVEDQPSKESLPATR
jgi:hypothetical protein